MIHLIVAPNAVALFWEFPLPLYFPQTGAVRGWWLERLTLTILAEAGEFHQNTTTMLDNPTQRLTSGPPPTLLRPSNSEHCYKK